MEKTPELGVEWVSPGVCFFSYPFWTAEERAVVLQVGVVFVVVCAGGVLLFFQVCRGYLWPLAPAHRHMAKVFHFAK